MKKKTSLSEQIHDKIMEIIIQESASEELIFTESSLVEQFGVSKAPVREALIKLCSEGILNNIPRYGYSVVRLSEKDARDIIQLRLILETEALKLSYEDITENHLDDMKNYLDAYGEKEMDIWQEWEDNIKFHTMLISYCNNDAMVACLRDSMNTQTRIFAQLSFSKNRSFSAAMDKSAHEQIFEALQNRDLEKALECLEKDIISTTVYTN